MAKLDTEIIINLAGNLTAKARQYGANMSEFAQRNQRAMSIVKATSEMAGRGLDKLGNRYTAAIAGFAGGSMLREFAKTDRVLTELGIAAGKKRKEMREIFSDTQDVAIKFRVDDSEVVKSMANTNKMTGDLDFAVKNKGMMAMSIAASGADGESIGGLFAAFQKFQVKTEEGNLRAMDTLNQLGKEGGFELKDFATSGTKIFSAYAGSGRTGPEAVKEMGVIMESAMDAVGDKDLAATASFNLLNDLRNPKIAKVLENSGVKLRDKLGNMLPINDIVKDIAQRSGKGGSKRQDERLAKAGFTDYSRLIISSVTTGKGAENFARYNAVVADGSSIIADAKYAAQDFTSAMTGLNVTWKKFTDSNLAKPVQELADALNSVDQATVQNWLEIGKNVALATGGIIVARKAFQIGKGAYDFLKPGNKGVPKGVTDVFGSGVMPVYVVNMGSSGGLPGTGAGGGNTPGAGGGSGSPAAGAATRGFWGLAGRAIGGAGMVYGMNEMSDYGAKTIYDTSGVGEWAKGSSFRSWVDESVNKSMLPTPVSTGSVWQEVKDWLTSAPEYQDPSPWASLQPQNQGSNYPMVPQQLQGAIEVTVKDERVQVTGVKINTPGVTLSAQTGISNVEQD